MAGMKKTKHRVFIWILIAVAFICGSLFFYLYKALYGKAYETKDVVYVYIDQNKDFDNLCDQLSVLASSSDINTFRLVADFFNYKDKMITGKYAVKDKMSNMELINSLRAGHQAANRITFNNIRLKDQLAERLSEQLMIDKEEIITFLNDPSFCSSIGFSTETISTLFIPNTYEVYWNISAKGLMNRMKREYDTFWTDARRAKAESLNMTPVEVSILASIVEEETVVYDEFPIVAGLYLNRLRQGILLQADPSVKFAVGDFSLKRILFEHLEVDSPYNTYKYAGLPPGPLRIPSIRGIDAVLNHTKHKYLYMCAKEDFSGRHNFAVTLAEHNRNAKRYHSELNRRNIR